MIGIGPMELLVAIIGLTFLGLFVAVPIVVWAVNRSKRDDS